MYRVISLFREPREEDHSPQSHGEIDCQEQPLYFQQLLEHLRERRDEREPEPFTLDERPQKQPMVLA